MRDCFFCSHPIMLAALTTITRFENVRFTLPSLRKFRLENTPKHHSSFPSNIVRPTMSSWKIFTSAFTKFSLLIAKCGISLMEVFT